MVAFHSQNSIAVVTLCLVLLLSTTICAREHVAMSKSRQQVGMRGNDSRLLQNSRRRRIEQVQKERPGIYREIGSTLGGPKSSKATPVPIPSTPVVEDNETSNTEGVSAAIEEATEAESVGSTTEATEDVESVGSTIEATEDVESVSPVTEEAAETESVSSSTEETAEIAESESSNTGETAEVVDASSSSFVITVPSETSEEVVESVDDSTDESGCNSVAAQEPPPLESSSRESTFSMTVDVVYEEFSLTTKEIESYLNDQSIPMALWIVDCEGKDSDNTIETAEGKLRRLVGETSTITYSQLGSWEATGALLWIHYVSIPPLFPVGLFRFFIFCILFQNTKVLVWRIILQSPFVNRVLPAVSSFMPVTRPRLKTSHTKSPRPLAPLQSRIWNHNKASSLCP